MPLGVAAAGPVSLLNVAATDEADPAQSPGELQELEALREQNRLLQQQLQELRQQQQQQPPAVVATLPAPVTAGRSSLGNVGSGAGALGGGLLKHRRAISVDIGRCSAAVQWSSGLSPPQPHDALCAPCVTCCRQQQRSKLSGACFGGLLLNACCLFAMPCLVYCRLHSQRDP